MTYLPLEEHARQAHKVAIERASSQPVYTADLPAGSSLVNVLGVDYVHTSDEAMGDLYLTTVGYRYADLLQPDNWFEPTWFEARRQRLRGTSLVYTVPTKPIGGESLDLVVKFSRVGEKVPIDTELIENLLCCEFNGPFEEFALTEELRHSQHGPVDLRIRTQLPLAIYVPPEETQPAHSERFQWRIARKLAQHPGVAIDIMRQYILIYRWMPGVDAWQAHQLGLLTEAEARQLNSRVTSEVRAKGFTVLDMKPEHVIVEPAETGGLVRENGGVRYGMIDYELMERTAAYWQELQAVRKAAYERRKRELLSFADAADPRPQRLPGHLTATRLLGVDYVHGRTESTSGMLWVVGRKPDFFDYFLPERWRTTPQLRLVDDHETYFTTSKDNIGLVWKVSRVGEPAGAAAFGLDGFRALASGINSPFEEVAAARWLSRQGVPAILPRAIYRTGHQSDLDESLFDQSRYRSHTGLLACDDEPVLDARRNYITIWDYWNGPQRLQTDNIAPVGRAVNASQAVDRGLLDQQASLDLAADYREHLAALGVEVFRLLPEHVLLTLDTDEQLVLEDDDKPCSCLCNFQYLRLPAVVCTRND